ncbi:hypothetical protein K504DRAFT_525308 [Pleomassaria siparia CBS 279.74]|uniref:Uncharacterized protein n=1 Tax=Pleomassaria siparia CBS 279.74 TaxID=1314801 RepID=A0A6G1KD21_9PLEO|nr:hypothetical protein K504DRAFT_525308 [Pleomassaria siparia CBS 279.74]
MAQPANNRSHNTPVEQSGYHTETEKKNNFPQTNETKYVAHAHTDAQLSEPEKDLLDDPPQISDGHIPLDEQLIKNQAVARVQDDLAEARYGYLDEYHNRRALLQENEWMQQREMWNESFYYAVCVILELGWFSVPCWWFCHAVVHVVIMANAPVYRPDLSREQLHALVDFFTSWTWLFTLPVVRWIWNDLARVRIEDRDIED